MIELIFSGIGDLTPYEWLLFKSLGSNVLFSLFCFKFYDTIRKKFVFMLASIALRSIIIRVIFSVILLKLILDTLVRNNISW